MNKLLNKLYDLSFKVESIIFNIPKSKEGESYEEYFEGIGVDKGLRFLRYKIRKHSPVTPELLVATLNYYKRKKDKEAIKKVFFLKNYMQEKELELYKELKLKKELENDS
ncbi:MAG: hypothetical protein ABIJ05_03170 [Patescibacteria group bacterium]